MPPSNVIISHYIPWCLGRQQSLPTSACPVPASSINLKNATQLSTRSQLFFSMLFSLFPSFSFHLASSEVPFCWFPGHSMYTIIKAIFPASIPTLIRPYVVLVGTCIDCTFVWRPPPPFFYHTYLQVFCMA